MRNFWLKALGRARAWLFVKKLRRALGGAWVRDFRSLAVAHKPLIERIAADRFEATKALKKLPSPADAHERYTREYLNASEISALTGTQCEFEGTHYEFLSIMLEPWFLGQILMRVGLKAQITEVGCGNGSLLEQIVHLGVPKANLLGFDLSPSGVSRVRERGIRAEEALFETVSAPKAKCLILSYLIDRANQKDLLRAAFRSLSPGGILVLNGLFPCTLECTSGVHYGEGDQTLTRGRDAVEDICLVVEFCRQMGLNLLEVNLAERWMYSLDGVEHLSETVLVMRKSFLEKFL